MTSNFNQLQTIKPECSERFLPNEIVVRQSLDAAWQTLVAARNAVRLDRQQVESAQSAYDGILVGLRAGERTTFDVLNTEQDLDAAQEIVRVQPVHRPDRRPRIRRGRKRRPGDRDPARDQLLLHPANQLVAKGEEGRDRREATTSVGT